MKTQKPEVSVQKEPKAEEPTAPAPKVEEPIVTPKVEEPTPTALAPKTEASEVKALLIQKRAKRLVEQKETVDVHSYFNLKNLPGITGVLDVDGDTTIQLPKEVSKE